MKKLLTALTILCASLALQAAYSDYYIMLSVCAPGAIRAVAYKGDKVRAEEEVRTAGPAARLALEPEKPAIAADGVELGYVTVKVCDAEGRIAPRACPQVSISVTGGGEFVAADNGDESDFTWFGAKERRAFNGLLSVIVRAKKGAVGPIEVKVESKGLEPATVMLKAKKGK